MAAGLVTASSGLLLFALATGIAWLFAARAVQGLAVGMLSGAASAALGELDPRPQEHAAALMAALAQAGASAAGPIAAGMLAEWAPAPRALCYLIVLSLTMLGGLAVLRIPEPGRVTGGRWKIQRPHVPQEIRVRFARLSITSAAVWAICALFLSVVPSYAAELLDTRNLALLGAVCGLILAASCVAQLAARRVTAFAQAQAAGLTLAAAASPRSWPRSRSTRCSCSSPPRCSRAPATGSRSWPVTIFAATLGTILLATKGVRHVY